MRMIVLLYAERLPEWFTAGQMRSIMGTDGRLTDLGRRLAEEESE